MLKRMTLKHFDKTVGQPLVAVGGSISTQSSARPPHPISYSGEKEFFPSLLDSHVHTLPVLFTIGFALPGDFWDYKPSVNMMHAFTLNFKGTHHF